MAFCQIVVTVFLTTFSDFHLVQQSFDLECSTMKVNLAILFQVIWIMFIIKLSSFVQVIPKNIIRISLYVFSSYSMSPMKLHHSNHCHPKTLQHCCHSCRASDSLVCVGSRALFVIGSWRFHWQVRKRSRSILTDVRRRCILKMGLPDVGWRSADI